ncbi:unnamed protein product [Prunus brigantina]
MLEVEFCGALTSLAGGLECLTSLQQFISLCKLFIYDYILESISSSLEELSLLGCTSLYLMHLPIDGLQTLVSLDELRICYCPNLEAVPNLDNLTSLRELHIYSCGGLTSIPSGLASCTSLTNLSIDSCPNLVSIAEDVSRLQSLTLLSIFDYGKLQCLLTGPQRVQKIRLWGWPKLKSLPQQIQHFTSLTSFLLMD